MIYVRIEHDHTELAAAGHTIPLLDTDAVAAALAPLLGVDAGGVKVAVNTLHHPTQSVALIEAARRTYDHGDDVEIDDTASVSPGGDDGAWVGAWVWVRHAEVPQLSGPELVELEARLAGGAALTVRRGRGDERGDFTTLVLTRGGALHAAACDAGAYTLTPVDDGAVLARVQLELAQGGPPGPWPCGDVPQPPDTAPTTDDTRDFTRALRAALGAA